MMLSIGIYYIHGHEVGGTNLVLECADGSEFSFKIVSFNQTVAEIRLNIGLKKLGI